jgi:uncharacterized protein YndB with AHSA1/START domain
MANILHRIEIYAKPENIYPAFSTLGGLKHWWTNDAAAQEEIKTGTIIQFRFGNGGPDMKVTKMEMNKRLEWECVAGDPEWVGTKFSFDLEPADNKTILRFSQRGWKEESDFYIHCNCRWAYFMLSLKSYIENGKGTPYPEAIPM